MSRPRFEELACPRCGHGDSFHVDVTATAYLDAAGPSVESDYYCDERSVCSCLRCNFEGSVADFVATKCEVTP